MSEREVPVPPLDNSEPNSAYWKERAETEAVMSNGDGVVLYLIHPAMRPWLDEFFQSRGFDVKRTPFLDDDEPDALPIYMPTLKEWPR